jgi:hypothetical protein
MEGGKYPPARGFIPGSRKRWQGGAPDARVIGSGERWRGSRKRGTRATRRLRAARVRIHHITFQLFVLRLTLRPRKEYVQASCPHAPRPHSPRGMAVAPNAPPPMIGEAPPNEARYVVVDDRAPRAAGWSPSPSYLRSSPEPARIRGVRLSAAGGCQCRRGPRLSCERGGGTDPAHAGSGLCGEGREGERCFRASWPRQ